MDERVKALWTSALRSGKYQQGHGALRVVENGQPKDCCLGVLCNLFAQENPTKGEWSGSEGTLLFVATNEFYRVQEIEDVLPNDVMDWAGLDAPDPILTNKDGESHEASYWNDGYKSADLKKVLDPATFAQIADLIERSL